MPHAVCWFAQCLNFRVYPSDLLGWSQAELLSLCVPFLLLAAILWPLRRRR